MYLYFISDGQYVKIGITHNIFKRIKGLSTGNPKQLELLKKITVPDYIAYKAEHNMHSFYNKYLVKNEWYSHDVVKELKKLSDDDITKICIGENDFIIYEVISGLGMNVVIWKEKLYYKNGKLKFRSYGKGYKDETTLTQNRVNV